jgi:hypothetical protein
MAETLLQFQAPVTGPDGSQYTARAVGAEVPGGTWHGWIEFVPLVSGEPLRSPRETTQSNRVGTVYWATGLTAVYLEGALVRALREGRPSVVPEPEPDPPHFDGPAVHRG